MDHVTAAAAGHVGCLERLDSEGHLLSSNAQERGAAGEARKAELWDAALVAGHAGHAHVFKWLFRAGWPAFIDATPEWQSFRACTAATRW